MAKKKSLAESVAENMKARNEANEAAGVPTMKKPGTKMSPTSKSARSAMKLNAEAKKRGMTVGEYANRRNAKKLRGPKERVKQIGREVTQIPKKLTAPPETAQERYERIRKRNLRNYHP